jgi:hypothetical protein
MVVQKKVHVRDNMLLDYDKWKTKVIHLTAKQKDPTKLFEAEKKFEDHKELYNKTNTELMAELKQVDSSKYNDFLREFKLVWNLWI